MTPDALLFDLDGLLLDTEVLAKQAFDETSRVYKIGDQTELFMSLVGTNEAHHTYRLEDVLSELCDPVKFRQHWNDHFHHLINTETVAILPGVTEVLEYADSHNIKCAVATSSSTSAAAKKLTDAGIRDYFLTVTCGDMVAISKPHPEIFEKAAASVNARPSRSIGLEDSANGVKAAHAAGLHVIQIPNVVPPSAELLSLGHRICNDMHEVLELLQRGEAIA